MSEIYEESGVIVRAANKQDMVHVVNMIQALADFEKMPDGPTLKAEDLQRDGFDVDPPLFRCQVAERLEPRPERPGDILGYAIYFNTYSTWAGKSMMLEDLYVKAEERKRGVGERLFNAVAAEAVQTDCVRLDFHVLRWNEARSFYERKGAVNLTETEDWCYFRLAGRPLQECAKYYINERRKEENTTLN